MAQAAESSSWRRVGNRRDLFEVQLDKNGRRAGFVNLASIKADRIETMFEGLIAADEVTTADLSESCRFRGNSWFGAFKPSFLDRIVSRTEFGRVIGERIVSRFHIADAWFRQRKSSSRLQQYRL